MTTPIRKALKSTSALKSKVEHGLGALGTDTGFVDAGIRTRFGDSLDVDEHLREGNEAANRWDYLLGDKHLQQIIGLEPHGASDKEVSVVIAKRKAALVQLRPHFRDGASIAAWFWVQSSGGGFHDTGKARRRANAEGITFVGRRLMAKHLDALNR